MKNIKNYEPHKYKGPVFEKKEDGIWFAADEYSTCLSFEQEPEYGEGDSPKNISQYPLEAILDKYLVYVSDFFTELNDSSETECYLEFCSPDINDVKSLRELIGKTARIENGNLVIS